MLLEIQKIGNSFLLRFAHPMPRFTVNLKAIFELYTGCPLENCTPSLYILVNFQKMVEETENNYKYQPSGAMGTRSPPATQHRLQNPERPLGGPKNGVILLPRMFWSISFWEQSSHASYFLRLCQWAENHPGFQFQLSSPKPHLKLSLSSILSFPSPPHHTRKVFKAQLQACASRF